MNFELQTLFKFQKTINEMQAVCIGIVDPAIREIATKRIDDLIETYKTFDKFYYSAHFNQQKVLQLGSELYEARLKIGELTEENQKLLKSLEWHK